MPLFLGRAKHRLASPAQRLALIAAERGCTRPGCDAPASLAAVHHIREWAKGGLTDLPNLTLACDRCHALVHDGPDGWKTVVMPEHSDYPGRTGWIAPAHIDPSGIPKVNHRHHADELLAQARIRVAARTEQVAQQRRKRLRCNRQDNRDNAAPPGSPPADGAPPAPGIE
ncbi:HNH endonuclease signature motif containing protein [Nocardia huaxiensis]|nr:HNH endonuclease signature motif containing protein [Nocardia huaxiensis]UFT00295.1 HNH endonuclease [Nocardia huaxiensis]